MSFTNTLPIIVDCDRCKLINATNNVSLQTLSLYRDTSYSVSANCYSDYTGVNIVDLSNVASYIASVGNIYGSNAAPVITISSGFGGTPSSGILTFTIPTDGSTLATDMGNSSSSNYTFEIWAYSNSHSVLINQSNMVIKNITVEP